MVFSYNWLQLFFKRKLPTPEKLANLLTLHFAEVEEVKKEGKDFILDIDVRPNRAGDCFCHWGIAREIAAILDLRLNPPAGGEDLRLKENKKLRAKDFIRLEVKDRNACPRYTARVITDVKAGESPKYIRERLKVCGLQPINNVVDAVNYVMLETGQPLHAFDFEKLGGKKIIVRFAKKGEKIVTLDEQKFDLDKNVLVIADQENPIAIAGIKGGKGPEINKNTKTVVLESANFNPRSIRRVSRLLNLKTDASWRFEHGLDPNLAEIAINRAAGLITAIAKGKVAQGIIDVYPKKVLPKKIKLDLNYVKSVLGIDIPEREIRKILTKLGFKVKSTTRKLKVFEVKVPTFRLDVSIPEDLIEEIGRVYGYERIKPVMPVAALIPPKRNDEVFWRGMTKNILKEIGFTETYNYSFVSSKEVADYNLQIAGLIEVENPVSQEQKYMRPSLIPNLLKNVKYNLNYFDGVRIFELGKIYRKIQNLEEKAMLTGVVAKKEGKEIFYELKGAVDLLLNKLGISDIWYDEYQATPEESTIKFWHPKECAEIKIGGEEIGFLGEISPKILENLKIKQGVCVFDIDFGKLSKLASEEHEYQPISSFPAAVRDLAILVPRDTRVEEVLNKVESAGGALVRDVDLFDIYEGEELPEGKKNFAFHIVYQAEDRTLTSREIDEIHNKIIEALEGEVEWEVRK